MHAKFFSGVMLRQIDADFPHFIINQEWVSPSLIWQLGKTFS